jgi:hypothetical protein
MKLWLLSQEINGGYDKYDSCIVVAETADDARLIHPDGTCVWNGRHWRANPDRDWNDNSWAPPECVSAQEVGTADQGVSGVLCASFNAG